MDKEDSFPLECSSGCESGWTMYLNQSYERPSTSLSAKEAGLQGRFVDAKNGDFVEQEGRRGEEEWEEEDDLSMVSDASSGPPHFHEEEDCYGENKYFFPAASAALKKRSSIRRRAEAEKEADQNPSFLDDTASSHVFCFSKSTSHFSSKQSSIKDVLDFSNGFSATHFKKHNDIVQGSSFAPEKNSRKISMQGRRRY